MICLRRLFAILFVGVMMVAATLFVFGEGTLGATVSAAQPPFANSYLPSGLKASNWQKFECQLSEEYEEIKLMAADIQGGDWFGISVGFSDETVVVGAVLEDGGPGNPVPDSGAAYIFDRNQGGTNNWGQVTKLTAGDAQVEDRFGVSVAISGDIVVVGAFGEDGGPGNPVPDSGAAYIFYRNQGGANNWGQVAKLTAGDVQAGDEFGYSVAISGGTVIVGEDGGPGSPIPNAGAAYIFDRNQGGANNWGQVTKLIAGDTQASDFFGRSVAISFDTVIVGAEGEDGGPGDPLPLAGAAYIFDRNQGGVNNWGQVAKLTAGDAQAADYFGRLVAIFGDTVVIGANGEDGGPGDPLPIAGAAYIFHRNQGGVNNWGQVVKLTAGDAQANDHFGYRLAINGNTVIVGAPYEDGGPGDPIPDAGATYFFHRDQDGANNWGQVAKLTPSDTESSNQFGSSVAISGVSVAVGAPGHEATYVFWKELDISEYLPGVFRP